MTGPIVTGPIATRRRRATNAIGVIVLIAAIPLGVAATLARAWVVPMLVVTAFAAATAGALAWLAGARRVPPPDAAAGPSYDSPPVHHERISRVRRSLVQATNEGAAFDRHLRPTFVRLANDRLRATHGITMTTHPDAARARLGEELWQRLTNDSPEPVPAAELRRIVSAIDRLSPPS